MLYCSAGENLQFRTFAMSLTYFNGELERMVCRSRGAHLPRPCLVKVETVQFLMAFKLVLLRFKIKFLPFRGSASVGCSSKNSFLGSASFVCSPNHVSDDYFLGIPPRYFIKCVGPVPSMISFCFCHVSSVKFWKHSKFLLTSRSYNFKLQVLQVSLVVPLF